MQTRREFLRNAALLSGGAMLEWGMLQGLVQQAYAIEPTPGTTFMDAEHVVILMQENRSFDHAYGTLQGVRGYNDPRAIRLPNGNPVWAQSNAKGETFAPFRLNIHDTKATWMSSLPHSWRNQVDARNNGKYDKWLETKKSSNKAYADMPLTLGHYTREDIPFYYDLADAFTICDQHFCSSITGTMPNRLFLMTGTAREKQSADSMPVVLNAQLSTNSFTSWMTFPERLEDHGVSWKIYQNELSENSGLSNEEDAWLGAFGCNIMEYLAQYRVKFSKTHREWIAKQVETLPAEIEKLKADAAVKKMTPAGLAAHEKKLAGMIDALQKAKEELPVYTEENWAKLSQREKNLHEKAFTTNAGDPDYRRLTEITYKSDGADRKMKIPKGDILHQFREDVKTGKLPTVSWLVAPEKLSDHPESAWYGAWYLSETLRILIENPELWKKTIFILTYDENDGYFDHSPPFVAPHPTKPETGFTSKGIDATTDYVQREQDKSNVKDPRESPIGLGYRVPMIVASPWTRGGCVCSQVLDSTSILQFLEVFLLKKTGREIKETNISTWRRAVCGDLTSLFQPAPETNGKDPAFVQRDPFVKGIFDAQFKPLPSGYKALSAEEIEQIRKNPMKTDLMPRQEKGVRRSVALAYELYVGGKLQDNNAELAIQMEARRDVFGEQALSSPFTVYARTGKDATTVRNYAVAAGSGLVDTWPLREFADGKYHVEAYGPNGFYREFAGSANDPALEIRAAYAQPSGNLELQIINHDAARAFDIEVSDLSYKTKPQKGSVPAGENKMITLTIDTQKSFQWYDVELTVAGNDGFRRCFAGRVETGKWGFSDPAMGDAV